MDAQNRDTQGHTAERTNACQGLKIGGAYKPREGKFLKSGTVILKTMNGSIFERHCRISIRNMGFESWMSLTLSLVD